MLWSNAKRVFTTTDAKMTKKMRWSNDCKPIESLEGDSDFNEFDLASFTFCE